MVNLVMSTVEEVVVHSNLVASVMVSVTQDRTHSMDLCVLGVYLRNGATLLNSIFGEDLVPISPTANEEAKSQAK
jgi:hypothetical protein